MGAQHCPSGEKNAKVVHRPTPMRSTRAINGPRPSSYGRVPSIAHSARKTRTSSIVPPPLRSAQVICGHRPSSFGLEPKNLKFGRSCILVYSRCYSSSKAVLSVTIKAVLSVSVTMEGHLVSGVGGVRLEEYSFTKICTRVGHTCNRSGALVAHSIFSANKS